jgi:hypothetical protein
MLMHTNEKLGNGIDYVSIGKATMTAKARLKLAAISTLREELKATRKLSSIRLDREADKMPQNAQDLTVAHQCNGDARVACAASDGRRRKDGEAGTRVPEERTVSSELLLDHIKQSPAPPSYHERLGSYARLGIGIKRRPGSWGEGARQMQACGPFGSFSSQANQGICISPLGSFSRGVQSDIFECHYPPTLTNTCIHCCALARSWEAFLARAL